MMSVLFAGMTAFALGCALLQGNLSALSDALLTGGSDAVSLMLRLVGGLCLWSGGHGGGGPERPDPGTESGSAAHYPAAFP